MKELTNAQAMSMFKNWCKQDERTAKGRNYISSRIDQSEEQDWFSLSLGFFSALGIGPTRCHNLAIKARYTHHYWR